MIEVIGNVAKVCTCKECGNVLKYMPKDVRKELSDSFCGYENYIHCPCGKKVVL